MDLLGLVTKMQFALKNQLTSKDKKLTIQAAGSTTQKKKGVMELVAPQCNSKK
jgi:hypothetical protein